MLTCWIEDSEEQDPRVLAQTLAKAAAVSTNGIGSRPELEICKEMSGSLAPENRPILLLSGHYLMC